MDALNALPLGALLGLSPEFWNGAVGGLAALCIVHVLPFGLSLAGGGKLDITLGRLLGALIVIAGFLFLGGLTAELLAEDQDGSQQEIIYGIGFQSTIGGFLQGVRAAD